MDDELKTDDQNVVRLGGGGLLYQDAREQQKQRDNPPKTSRARARPKESPASPPPSPVPWQPPAPAPERDWRQIGSTAAEILGAALISGGVLLRSLWLGLVVAGLCIVLLAVAAAWPARPK